MRWNRRAVWYGCGVGAVCGRGGGGLAGAAAPTASRSRSFNSCQVQSHDRLPTYSLQPALEVAEAAGWTRDPDARGMRCPFVAIAKPPAE